MHTNFLLDEASKNHAHEFPKISEETETFSLFPHFKIITDDAQKAMHDVYKFNKEVFTFQKTNEKKGVKA